MPIRWQDSLRTATDLAVVGFLVVLAAVPVVTAGAAVLTGSRAVRHFLERDAWPSAAQTWLDFRRALLPGLAGFAAVAVAAGLIAVDLIAVAAGRVPGGPAMTVLLVLLAAGLTGLTGLAVVESAGPREVLRLAAARPVVPVAIAGVVVLAAALMLLIHPALTPVLLGFTLFAINVVAAHRREQRNRPLRTTSEVCP